MALLEKEIVIEASPDDVWAIVGDVANVADWFEGIEESSVQDGIRYVTMPGGMTVTERITGPDHENRTYQYEIIGDMPLDKHHATVTVHDHADGTLLTWHTEVEPDAIADVMGLTFDVALASLKNRLEA